MKILPLLALSFLLASTSLVAQQASPTKEVPPDPPLINNAPAEAQWTITYTLKIPEKDPPSPQEANLRYIRRFYNPLVLSKHVIKSGGQMAIFTDYEAGMKTEAWVINTIIYELPFRKGEIMTFEQHKYSDFSEIDWIKAGNFRGTVDLKGAKVHLYESSDAGPAPDAAQKPPNGPVRRAYIDSKTRLPIMADLGDRVLTYQYAAPTALPEPDDRIKKVMQEISISKKK